MYNNLYNYGINFFAIQEGNLLTEGKLYFLNKPNPNRPIEDKYIAEIEGQRKAFEKEEAVMLFLFDNGVRTYKYLTKEDLEYKDLKKHLKNSPTYEFWKIENRVGYVSYSFELYVDGNGEVKQRKAFVWRFIGFGRSCFAQRQEELKEKVTELIKYYKEDPEKRGFNTYPFYTKHYRPKESK